MESRHNTSICDERRCASAATLGGALDGVALRSRKRLVESGGVDQAAFDAVEVELCGEIVARRAGLMRDQRRRTAGDCVEETALAGVRPADQHGLHRIDRLAARVDLPLDGGHLALGFGQAAVQLLARDKRQVLVGEIETGLDVGG